MPRKITSGVVGGPVLGNISSKTNTFQSVETNANIVFSPNGTGVTEFTKDIFTNGEAGVRFGDGDTNYALIKAPAALSGNYTLTLPANNGSASQTLTTDGSGALTWETSGLAVSNQLSDSNTYYPTLTTATSGTATALNTSSTKLSFVPSTGTLTATALVETSSIALKENINPITGALNSILQLAGVTYDRKDGSYKNEAGLIAEDVNSILPNLVTKDSDGNPYGVNYTKFSAYLIEAIKDLSAQIDNLKQDK
tara:strand:+ start:251 stop:1009 length:759 start_codon:yes stop_codon:yes gene_type:complete